MGVGVCVGVTGVVGAATVTIAGATLEATGLERKLETSGSGGNKSELSRFTLVSGVEALTTVTGVVVSNCLIISKAEEVGVLTAGVVVVGVAVLVAVTGFGLTSGIFITFFPSTFVFLWPFVADQLCRYFLCFFVCLAEAGVAFPPAIKSEIINKDTKRAEDFILFFIF